MLKKLITVSLIILQTAAMHATGSTETSAPVTFVCEPANGLYQAYSSGMGNTPRFDDSSAAISAANSGSSVLILADGYPNKRTVVSTSTLDAANAKALKLYIEFPESLPGISFEEPRSTRWERLVIASKIFSDQLPYLTILDAHSCTVLPTSASVESLVTIGRVAGFDKAVYGLPTTSTSALFRHSESPWLIGTTGLSHFERGRYAPVQAWDSLWKSILKDLTDGKIDPKLTWQPIVRPSFGPDDFVSLDTYTSSLHRLANWYMISGLMPDAAGEKAALAILKTDTGTSSGIGISTANDGKHGIFEGFESTIQPDGSQNILLPLRADCIAESAMALALNGSISGNQEQTSVAHNFLDYVYFNSGLCGGDRAVTSSPAYGLIGWGIGSAAWETANYGDDNARTLLATIVAGSTLNSTRWNDAILRAVLANYRTTGASGHRGDRIDMPELTRNGWRHYFEAAPVNNSPHFEAYLWACYLWAYKVTDYKPLFDRAKAGISNMMKIFPNGWRRNDMLERAHMVLPLAWLVRVEDTAENRAMLTQITDELLKLQEECGAIPETENGGQGHYRSPKSNEEYGTAETPLIHQTGDKASDQLYTTGFTLIGLHEAYAVTGDIKLKKAEDRLADYLLRIQTRSDNPRYDGIWFRAFDYGKWDYWASSADMGWGAWVIETGWGQTWIAATFALREQGTSLWELSLKLRPEFNLASELNAMELPPK